LAETPLPTVLAEDVFTDVYLEDQFFASHDYLNFSVIPIEGFNKWSVWREQKFAGYDFDLVTRELSKGTAPTLNWEETKQTLLSRDLTPEQEAAFDDKLKNGALFLDGTS
jgi:hypothetical protein